STAFHAPPHSRALLRYPACGVPLDATRPGSYRSKWVAGRRHSIHPGGVAMSDQRVVRLFERGLLAGIAVFGLIVLSASNAEAQQLAIAEQATEARAVTF